MTDHHDQTVHTLNRLIETCRDGEEGFRTAVDGIAEPMVKSLFEQIACQRGEFAAELADEVVALGGRAVGSGSISGALHRGWRDIRSIVSGARGAQSAGESAVIAEAERSEDVAKAAYEEALCQSLPPAAHALVQRQYSQVKAVHDKVRSLEKSDA
jgi:uncharacterized protein (TIGR02284 family)